MKFIVTAGGQGTKIWPYSRKDYPKQFQKIVGDESLFTYNINLLLEQHPAEDIFISTKRKYLKIALDQAPRIPLKNYIIEPDVAKNRGPGEGLAFLKLSMLHPDDPFMIVQTDDIRLPADKYLKMIKTMEKVVRRDRKFLTGGMETTYPVLGVDYFLLGKKVNSEEEIDTYEIKEFLGRTNDYRATEKLIKENNVLIHCNHACWFPDLMLEAYQKYRPDWYEALMKIKDVIGTSDEDRKIEEIYETMAEGPTEDVTKHVFDYGYTVVLPFKWIDIGTWNSLYEYMSDETGNYSDGQVIAIESQGSLVKSSNKEKLIAILGLDNMVVVDTDDILLIVPRDKADKVKDIQEELEKQNMTNFL